MIQQETALESLNVHRAITQPVCSNAKSGIIGLFILLGVFIQVKSTRYKLTNQRFLVRTGLISKKVEELELFRIKDVIFSQGIVQRLLGVGNITILSTDDSTPRVELVGISNPEKTKESIRSNSRAARKGERGLTEFIQS